MRLPICVRFQIYMVVVYFFELYMLPLVLLLLFVKAYVYKVIIAGIKQREDEDVSDGLLRSFRPFGCLSLFQVYFESEEEDEELDEKVSGNVPMLGMQCANL